MRFFYSVVFGFIILLFTSAAFAQTVSLPLWGEYSTNFNALNTGTTTPNGWSVTMDATATSLGTLSTNLSIGDWTSFVSGWYNSISIDSIISLAGCSGQSAGYKYLDRALAVRQDGTGAGAALVLTLTNTLGWYHFLGYFSIQQLDDGTAGKTTTWKIQYSTNGTDWIDANILQSSGETCSWATFRCSQLESNPNITRTTQGTNKNNLVLFSFGELSSNDDSPEVSCVDNYAGNVYIRIVALDASTGSGTYPFTAIDNFLLGYDPFPAPLPDDCPESGGDMGFNVDFNLGAGSSDTTNYSDVSGGTSVKLPTPTVSPACAAEGWTFLGWTNANVPIGTTSVPSPLLAAGSSITVNSDTTLYAVYQKGSAGGNPTLTDDITAGDYVIGAVVGTVGSDNKIAAINATITGGWQKYTDFTPSSGIISSAVSNAHIWTLAISGSGFTLRNRSTNEFLVLGSGTGTGSGSTSMSATSSVIYKSIVSAPQKTFNLHQSSTATNTSGNQLANNRGSGYGYRMYAQRPNETTDGGITTDIRFYKINESLTYATLPSCVPPPTLSVTPGVLNFGNQLVSTPSSPQTITISGLNLTDNITYYLKSGGLSDFSTSVGTFSATSGGTLNIIFNPSSIGAKSDSIIIESSGLRRGVQLNGTGIQLYSITLNPGTGSVTSTTLTQASSGETLSLPTPTLCPEATAQGWTFAGWSNAVVGSETPSAPSVLIPAGSFLPTKDTTFYAVYKKGTCSTNDTLRLLQSEISAHTISQSYTDTLHINSLSGVWTGHMIKNGTSPNGYLQINNANNYHIKSPVFANSISSIKIYTTNSTTSGRTFYICSNNSTAQPSTGDLGSGSIAGGSINISLTGNPTSFYIYSNGAAYVSQVDIMFVGGGTCAYYSSPACIPVPTLNATPSTVNFGSEVLGVSSTPETVTVNASNLTCANITWALKRGNQGFVQTGTSATSGTIASSGGALNFTFTTSAEGNYSDTLIVCCAADNLCDTVILLAHGGCGDGPFTVILAPGVGVLAATSITQTSVGQEIILPEPTLGDTCVNAGWSFAGWSEDSIPAETQLMPSYYTLFYTPTCDIKLYAVYVRNEMTDEEYYEPDATPRQFVLVGKYNGRIYAIPKDPMLVFSHGIVDTFNLAGPTAAGRIEQEYYEEMSNPSSIATFKYPETGTYFTWSQWVNGIPDPRVPYNTLDITTIANAGFVTPANAGKWAWTIQNQGGYYTIYNGSSYLSYDGSGTKIKLVATSAANNARWNIYQPGHTEYITQTHSKYTVENVGTSSRALKFQVLQYVAGQGNRNLRFACYSHSNQTANTGGDEANRIYVDLDLLPILENTAWYHHLPDCQEVMPPVSFAPNCADTVFVATGIVTLSSSVPGATIYYTIDGSIPDSTKTLYTSPITITSTTAIRAIAYSDGWTTSVISSAAACTYTVAPLSRTYWQTHLPLNIPDLPTPKSVYFRGTLTDTATLTNSNPLFSIGGTNPYKILKAGINVEGNRSWSYNGDISTKRDSTTVVMTCVNLPDTTFNVYYSYPLVGWGWHDLHQANTSNYGIQKNVEITPHGLGAVGYTDMVLNSRRMSSGSWNVDNYWQIEQFSTVGWENLKFSAWMSSLNALGAGNGPRDWKLQYSTDNSTWNDLQNWSLPSTDYFTGDIALPAVCNNNAAVWLRIVCVGSMGIDGSNNYLGSATSGLYLVEIHGDDICANGNLRFNLAFNSIACTSTDDITLNITGNYPFEGNKYDIRIDNSSTPNLQSTGYSIPIAGFSVGTHTITTYDSAGCSVTRKLKVLK
ncbi:hypothetical protein FACS1894178_1710 [Bacteroidia bacterium]|nr:hypothetical protein FACS1894178_1710 [Bacteroidia bacterium]